MQGRTISLGRDSVAIISRKRRGRGASAALAAAAMMAAAAMPRTARAATYVFDPGGQSPPTTASDGPGAWDGITSDWYNTSGTGPVGLWGNTTADVAIFGAGGSAGTGTVNVGTVNVGTIDFNAVSGSYSLLGGTITLGGASVLNASGASATIASNINNSSTGASGLNVFAGSNTLTLSGNDTFGGVAANIASGTLVLSGTTVAFGSQVGVGTANSPAGASAAAPNVATLTIANGTTVTAISGANYQNFGLGNTDTAANQLFVANINGTLNCATFFTQYKTSTTATAIVNVNNGGTLNCTYFSLGETAGTTTYFNVSGGTVTLPSAPNQSVTRAFAQVGANVILNLTAGSLTIPSYFYLTNLAGQTTTVTQTNGTFTATGIGTDGLFFGTGLATYNLAGGILSTTNVGKNSGPTAGSAFIFNGGTLQLRATSGEPASTGFFFPPSAVVGANGGTIDTQTFNATTPQAIGTGVTGVADGGLAKAGSGTLTFTGASTYTGPTNVNGGTFTLSGTGSVNGSSRININGAGAKLIQLSTTASTPAINIVQGLVDGTGTVGAVTVGNNAAAGVNNGNGAAGTLTTGNLSFSGAATDTLFLSSVDLAANGGAAINVNGTLSSAAAGKVALNFTGTITPGSTYDLFKYSAFSGSLNGSLPTDYTIGTGLNGRVAGSSSLAVTSTTGAGYLQLIVGSADNNIRWTGATDNAWQAGQSVPNTNWVYANASSGTVTPFFNGDNVTFDDAGANANPVNISAATVSPSSVTFNNSTATYNISSTGGFGIAGSGALVKNGAGVLILSTSNSYSGGTTVNAGTLDVGTATSVGTGLLSLGNGTSGTITLDNISGTPLQLTNTGVAIGSDLTFVGSSSLNLGSGAGTLSGNRTINVSANTLYIGSALSGSGSLTKIGAGTLSLGAVNPFNNGNGVTVNAGVLNLLAGGAAGAVNGPLTINAGQVNAGAVDALGYNAGSAVTTLTANTGTVFNLSVSGNDGFLTNLVLNGASVTGVAGAKFNFATNYGITTLASSSQANISSGVYIRNSGNTMAVNVAQGSTASGTDLLISGVIQGDGGTGLLKLGNGTLTLTGVNATASTFTGTTNVSAGVVNLSGGGGASTLQGALIIGNGAVVNATVQDALGYTAGEFVTTLTVNKGGLFRIPRAVNQGFNTNVVLAGGTVEANYDLNDDVGTNGLPAQFNFATASGITALVAGTGPTTSYMDAPIDIRNSAALPINTASGATLLVTQAIIDNQTQFGAANGNGSIVKTGPGTLIIMPRIDSIGATVATNGNAYKGGTTVVAGQLFADNDSNASATGYTALGTGTTTVASGATLGGDGFTGGPVVVNGMITGGPDGVRVGTLTTTTQTWNTGGGYLAKVVDTSNAQNDVLIMSGLTGSTGTSAIAGFTITLQSANGSSPAFNVSNPTVTTTGGLPAGSFIVLATDRESAATNPFASPATIAALNAMFVNNGIAVAAPGDTIVLSSQPNGSGYDLIAEDIAAPEPASLLLAAVAVTPFALGRRRRPAASRCTNG